MNKISAVVHNPHMATTMAAVLPWLPLASLSSISYPELLLSIACFVFLVYFPRRHKYEPIDWPIIGMLPAAIAHVHELHEYVSLALHEVGCTFFFRGPRLMGMDLLISCDPANANHVFNANFLNYPKGEDFNQIFEILGNSIFNADGDSWKLQRKLAHGFVGDRSFRTFVAAATRDKSEKGLLRVLGRAEETRTAVDLQDVFMRVSFDVTCEMVFGVDPGCLSSDFPTIPFAKAIDDSWEALLARHVWPKAWWKLLKWLNVGNERRLAHAWAVIDEFIAQQVAERREECRNGASDMSMATNLLASYINHAMDEIDAGKREQDKFLRDTMLTMMIAGRDGFAITLTWFFWLLSKNPKVEAKILEELRRNQSRKGSKVFHLDDVSNMTYLHAAVWETQRLFPPVPYECKSALAAEVLPSGHRVFPGMKIFFSVYAMGRLESVWGKDCMEFRPERWIGDNGRLKHVPSYKFMVFNTGPRICPGRDIAVTQIKTVVAALMWNFEVDVLEHNVVAPKNSVLLRMKNPLMVKVRKRQHY